MDGFFAWVETSAFYVLLRQANLAIWDLWLGSGIGRVFNQSLKELWRASVAGHLVRTLVSWAGRSAFVTVLVAVTPRPSSVALWLRRLIGEERDTFPVTALEKILLYLVVFFVPVELWLITRLPSSVKYLGDLGLALLFLGTLIRLQQAGWPLRRSPADLPVALLLAAALLSTIWNAVPLHIAIFGIRAYLEYFALYFVVLYLPLDAGQRRRLLLWLLLFGVAIALFGDAQKFLHVATPRQWLAAAEAAATRVFGTMGNPNTFGAFLAWLLALLVALLVLPTRGGLRLLALIGCVIAGPALVFTLSREALVAMAAALLFIGIVADRRLLLLLIVGVLALPVLDPHIVSRFALAVSGSYIRLSSSYGRLLFWERGMQAFLAQPLLGWGPGRFGGSVAHLYGSPVYRLFRLDENPIIDSQHVQTLVELGLIGYIAYLWLGFAAVRAGLRLFRGDRDPFWRAMGLGLAAGTVGFYIQSLFASLLETHQVVLFFWLVFGLVAYRLRVTVPGRAKTGEDTAAVLHDQRDLAG